MYIDINPSSAVSKNATYFRDRLAVVYEGGDLTFGEVEDRMRRLSTVLSDRGIGEGDRVAYLGLNGPSYIITMLATMRVGAIYVPLNFRLAEPELESVLERSGATLIVAEDSFCQAINAVRDRTSLKTVLLVDDDPCAPVTGDRPRTEPWSEILESVTSSNAAMPRHFDDPAAILFSSGSTGRPKGIVLTHGNLWWNSVNTDLRMDTQRRDVTLASAPLFHIGALNSFVLRSLVRGGTMVIRRQFDAVEFLDDIERFAINTTFAVPAMLDTLLNVPDVWTRDFSSLRTLVVSGSPVPRRQIKIFADHGIVLQQAWGMTEFAPTATHLPPEYASEKAGSAGIPMPYTEVRVVDLVSGEPVEAGTPGELVVRGPNVTPGYWQDPGATAEVFDAEGWFHSGDIGYVDEDGFFFIVDRMKDLIISGGENVYSAEVERVLSTIPGVTDVAVVGTPDSQWGESVVAFCSVAQGVEISLEQIRQVAGEQIARYKLPRRLEIVQSMPRNALGKLDKPKLRSVLLS